MEPEEPLNEDADLREAWDSKRYDIILAAIQSDFEFPENFDANTLTNGTEDEKRLKQLIEERYRIHQYIEDDNIKELKSLIINVKSKLYLNLKNQSAIFTAIQSKNFQIYAFLKSIGAEFKDENEKSILDNLSDADKEIIQAQLAYYLPRRPQAHIHYLISKSTPSKPVSNFDERVKMFYETLDQISEISTMLKVIQYSDYLDVVLDFDNENIADLCPHASKNTRGQTNYKHGRLYIAGRQNGEEKVLGTLAHELMHMAMDVIYENDCNPYFRYGEENEKRFNDVAESIKIKFRNSNINDDIEKVVMDGFTCYEKQDHNSELIARIPHILAQFPEGRGWLDKEAKDLMDYFNEVVLTDCQKFVEESYLLKPKNEVQSINEKLGEIRNVQKYSALFSDVSHIQDFIKNNAKNVLLIKGENTWMTLLSTLQGLYGKDYKNQYSNYIVVKFDVFVYEAKKIIQTFCSAAANTIILSYSKDSEIRKKVNLQEKGIDWISDLVDTRPDKRVIFVIHNDMEFEMKRILKEFNLTYACESDKNVTLNDLDDVSQELVLKKRIYFQGKRITLKNLLGNKDEMKSLIDAETIADLLLDRKIEVGKKSGGFAGLDNAYTNMKEEIDPDILTDVLENTHSKMFVFEQINSVREHFISAKTEKELNHEIIEKILSGEEHLKIVQEDYTDEDFKILCRDNFEKDVYWIQILKNQNLLLRKLYTPRFYIERKFLMYKEIVIKVRGVEELSKCEGTKCLISNTTAEEFLEFYRTEIVKEESEALDEIENSTKDKKIAEDAKTDREKIFDTNRITCVKSKEEAKYQFQELLKTGETIYWLEKIGDELIYKNSQGSLFNLKKHIDEENSQKSTISESDLAKKLTNTKLCIVADDPGMGKSTTITRLCHSELSKSHWVIKIDSKAILKNFKEIIDIENLVTLLAKTDINLDSHLAKSFLKAALDERNNFSKPLLIVFDGFNEVLNENNRRKIILLLKFINEKTKAKLFITARRHLKKILEDCLSTFAVEFQPMGTTEEEEFITRYLKTRFSLTFNKNIFEKNRYSLYLKTFLTELNTFKNDFNKFIGTPLILYLMLANVAPRFKNWVWKQSQNDATAFNLGKDISEVYSNFINKQYDYYHQMKNNDNDYSLKAITVLCEEFHMKLAKELTLNSNSELSLKDFKGIAPNIPLACGIVNCENDRLKFIHPTFQEYYAARQFTAWLEEPHQNKQNLNVFEIIFVHDHFQVIHRFLDFKIQENQNKSIKSFHKAVSKGDGEIVKLMLSMRQRKATANDFQEFLLSTDISGLNALHLAAQNGHFDVLQILLEYAKKISSEFQYKCMTFPDQSQRTLLHVAVTANNRNMVELILNKVPKETMHEFLSVLDSQKMNALHIPASNGNGDIVKLILEKLKDTTSGNNIEDFLLSKYNSAFNALNLAIQGGHFEVQEILLDFASGLSPEFQFKWLSSLNYQQCTPLDIAVEQQNQKSVELILKKTPTEFVYKLLSLIDYSKENDLHKAAKKGNGDIVKLILDRLKKATCRDDVQAFLLSEQISGLNAFHLAAQEGLLEVLQVLVEYAAELSPEFQYKCLTSLDNRQYTPLNVAASKNHLSIAEYILKEIPRESMAEFMRFGDFSKENAIHTAVKYGNGDMVTLILNILKEKTSAKDFQGFLFSENVSKFNELHVAVDNRDSTVLEILLQFAKDLSPEFQYEWLKSLDSFNRTPLHKAVLKNDRKMVESILKMIPTEWVYEYLSLSTNDENALHKAASKGYVDIVKLILDKLKEISSAEDFYTFLLSRTTKGFTALHLAAKKGHSDILQIIFDYAPEPDFRYKWLTSPHANQLYGECQTPLHIAVLKNYQNVLELILKVIPTDKMYTIFTMKDDLEENILHKAALKGNAALVKLILDEIREITSVYDFQDFLLSGQRNGLNALHLAAEGGHCEVLQILLENAEKLTLEFQYKFLASQDPKYCTPLHLAVLNHHPNVVDLIVNIIPAEKVYKFLSLCKVEGHNALHTAVTGGNSDILKLILDKLKETIPTVDFQAFLLSEKESGFNALHLAAVKNHCNVIQILLEYAAEVSPDFQYKYLTSLSKGIKKNAVYYAAYENHYNAVDLMLKMIPTEEIYEYLGFGREVVHNIFHRAVRDGAVETAKVILDVIKEKSSAHDLQALLLSEWILGSTALHVAAQEDDPATLQMLLDYAAELSPNFQYEWLMSQDCNHLTPLQIAVKYVNYKNVKLILKTINRAGKTECKSSENTLELDVLGIAITNGEVDMMKLILDEKKRKTSNVDFETFLLSKIELGCNSFHLAAQYSNHKFLLKLLFDHAEELSPGFQYKCLTSLDHQQCTPLHTAVKKLNLDKVRLILDKIPTERMHHILSLEDQSKENCLHKAASSSKDKFWPCNSELRRNVIKLILNKFKETTTTDDFQSFLLSKTELGFTALHLAQFQEGCRCVAEILLDYAEQLSPEFQYKWLTTTDNKQCTPLHIALEQEELHHVELILEKIPTKRMCEFLRLGDSSKENALHKAVSKANEKVKRSENIYLNEKVIKLILNKTEETTTTDDFQSFLLSKTELGFTALHLAVQHHKSVADILLNYVPPEFRYKWLATTDNKQCTPLHIALERGDRHIVELILKNIPTERMHEYLRLEDCSKENALHKAVSKSTEKVIKLILNKIKETTTTDDFQSFLLSKTELGFTALHLAIQRESDLRILLNYVPPEFCYKWLATTDNKQCTPLHIALERGNRYTVELILKNIPTERMHEYLRLEDYLNENAFNKISSVSDKYIAILIAKFNAPHLLK